MSLFLLLKISILLFKNTVCTVNMVWQEKFVAGLC